MIAISTHETLMVWYRSPPLRISGTPPPPRARVPGTNKKAEGGGGGGSCWDQGERGGGPGWKLRRRISGSLPRRALGAEEPTRTARRACQA
eukprot:CAMPEP_0177602684 /NCGR_PEP_ID=MMETSP0419_2-20121207/15029_1 /TAXON_ID=582737 /ORGANISM="Tetraselmis sp., Strain GSL018" /LENGTH=90 /DNA_ID=CAMNT_0019096243 /DNA_START=22 /DNA_END=292 /DNA_ORIENTATION=-